MLTGEEGQWYKVGSVGDAAGEREKVAGKKSNSLKVLVDTANGFEYSPPSEHGSKQQRVAKTAACRFGL